MNQVHIVTIEEWENHQIIAVRASLGAAKRAALKWAEETGYERPRWKWDDQYHHWWNNRDYPNLFIKAWNTREDETTTANT